MRSNREKVTSHFYVDFPGAVTALHCTGGRLGVKTTQTLLGMGAVKCTVPSQMEKYHPTFSHVCRRCNIYIRRHVGLIATTVTAKNTQNKSAGRFVGKIPLRPWPNLFCVIGQFFPVGSQLSLHLPK